MTDHDDILDRLRKLEQDLEDSAIEVSDIRSDLKPPPPVMSDHLLGLIEMAVEHDRQRAEYLLVRAGLVRKKGEFTPVERLLMNGR